ncbi:MAG: IclR family transcriptional regulator [Alphaproteobacteria bacterium]|nr:MAG: IclR family transcriptional regulator [Alphaproteobacteria bacterium]
MTFHPTTARRGKTADTLFVGSVEKAFAVLRAFRAGQRDLGLRDLSLSQISQLSGLDKSASQRFTNTLVELGYLEKDPQTRRYRPAIGLTEFYYTYIVSNRLAEIAMPRLIEASKAFGTTVNLCEPSGTEIVYTIRVPHEKAFFRATVPGRRMPAYCTASGIVMLAHRPEAEMEAILKASQYRPITRWTVTDPAEARERIEAARRDGYAVCAQQAIIHEISTAAPVLNSEGRAFAAVQVPVYMPEWDEDSVREKIVPLVIETARAISGSYFVEH